MHTLGHPIDAGHHGLGHAAAAMSTAMPPAESDGALAATQRAHEHDTSTMLNSLNVCLAVLAGGILLLLATMLCRLRRAGPTGDHIMAVRGQAGRGPPDFVLVGLALADLSVQRT